MKKYISCKECLHITSEETVCDTCNTQLSYGGYIIHKIGKRFPINVKIYDTDYDFCNLNCLKIFVDAELKKETE